MRKSAFRPSSSESSISIPAKVMSPTPAPGSNSTSTSTSLSGAKSSRSTEPKKENLRMRCLRQNAASFSWGTSMGSLTAMVCLMCGGTYLPVKSTS
mgnify:CR=1 FL=1